MTLRLTIGVDPGQSGALAVLADGDFLFFVDMPLIERKAGGFHVDPIKLAHAIRLIRRQEPGAHVSAVLEQVSAGGPNMRGRTQGVTSAFRFGESYGVLRGVLGALGIPFVTVVPMVWKRAMRLTGKDKDASRVLAIDNFPSAAQFLQLKKHVGRADALLVAHYGYLREFHALPSSEHAKNAAERVLRSVPEQLELAESLEEKPF